MAIFNVVMSMMPPKVLKVTNFMGYGSGGGREKGFSDLEWLSQTDNLHQMPANIFIAQFHLFITTFLDNFEGDFDICRKVLDRCLEETPDSAIFRLLNGRYYLLTVSYIL